MANNAPGKHFRKGLSLIELTRKFPDDQAATEWVERIRWPDGPRCPHCTSDSVQCNAAHKTMTHRCRTCRKWFSVRTGTCMQSSKLGLQTWVFAVYLMNTELKSRSSMKLHRDLEITQKSAWHLAHRIREAWDREGGLFSGETEADESHWGGKEGNKHAVKKLRAGRGTVGKTPVAGLKNRDTGQIKAKVVPDITAKTLQGFVAENTEQGSTVYTDEATAYVGLKNRTHESVKHSAGEYVRKQAHTNGIESFWAMLRRGHNGTFHHFSEKHLQRYVTEFAGRHNSRNSDTIDMMAATVSGMIGKRLRYEDLTAP